MAEGFDSPYHVPQQSRRDKLRVGCNFETNHHLHHINSSNSSSLLPPPFYDPCSIMQSSELLTCASFQHGVKEERMNLMGYISSCSSSNSQHNLYNNMDPPQSNSTFVVNPPTNHHIQDLTNTNHPINYNHLASQQNNQLRVLDHQSFNGVLSNGQGLSLSLSSQQTCAPLSLNHHQRSSYEQQQPYNNNDLSRSSVPLGPFTGYASILKGSRFLKPAQQMLEEICDVDKGNFQTHEKYDAVDACLLDPPLLHHNLSRSDHISDDDPRSSGEHRSKKSKLLCMLDEVYKRYRQYYQQMQAVVTSFESVAGLSTAAPFANFALKAMSKHFRYLKNAITDQLQFTIKSYGQVNYGKDGITRAENAETNIYGQKAVQNMGFIEHQPVWRPQRGLPERAVTVLRAWLFEHFLHPYPTDTDKLMLAKQTGLSRNQVSNWFINARVRLWKPMVEEIHNLETRQKPSQRDEQNADKTHATDSVPSENASTSTQRVHDLPSKRSRDDYSNNLMTGEEPMMNSLYGNTMRHQHIGVGMNGAVGTSGVSLTLGLHQNNGKGMSEPFAMNAARRFGIDASNEGFVMGTFEAQNRQFGRDYIGGQLLHDFVG